MLNAGGRFGNRGRHFFCAGAFNPTGVSKKKELEETKPFMAEKISYFFKSFLENKQAGSTIFIVAGDSAKNFCSIWCGLCGLAVEGIGVRSRRVCGFSKGLDQYF